MKRDARPNILVFMTDHQRADTALPDHPARTPRLDSFQRQGISFTNAHCPSPHCCPSRATFFSGLYPSRHGVWNNVLNGQALRDGLRPGVRLWSEDLAEAGYGMHWCGKWHVSARERPADRGWTEHFVSAGPGTSHGIGWERYQAIAKEPDPAGRGEGEILRPGYGTYRLYGTREETSDDHDETAVRVAEEVLAAAAGRPAPWALFVGLIGPHDPYMVPSRFLDLYAPEEVPLPPSYGDAMADKPGLYARMREQVFGQLSPREVREGIRHFWAYCTRLDDLFGRVLAALDRTGQAEDTLVLYCSDHGDYCGEHGLFAKGIPCFRGAYHVPAILRWPGRLRAPARRSDAPVSLADFAPTFLEAAGIPAGRRFTGSSLMPFLLNRAPEGWRDEMHTQCNGVELYCTQRSVATRDWKYVFNGFDRDELYDLRADPHETRNLAADPATAETRRALCGRLWRFAHREEDEAINAYVTVALAPYGPAEAFR
jgi:arylsulfatase A-like enzyme